MGDYIFLYSKGRSFFLYRQLLKSSLERCSLPKKKLPHLLLAGKMLSLVLVMVCVKE